MKPISLPGKLIGATSQKAKRLRRDPRATSQNTRAKSRTYMLACTVDECRDNRADYPPDGEAFEKGPVRYFSKYASKESNVHACMYSRRVPR